MKRIVFCLAALIAANGFCAEKKTSPFAAMDEARKVFNKSYGEVFRGAKAIDYRVIGDDFRFDRAKGDNRWIIAMPLKKDSRIKFAVVQFKDGAFVSGELMKFGLKAEKICEKDFASLRHENSMFAARFASDGKVGKVAFYPAGMIKDAVRNNLIGHGIHMRVDPMKYYLERVYGIDRVLGINMADVKYVYTITTASGDVIEMGFENKGYKMVRIMRAELEKRYPEKKGLFSDRDIVYMYCTALITYRPVHESKGK